MQAASTDFATAVAGVEYYAAWRVQMTLPGGVYPDVTLAVEKISIDASTTTDMPAGSRLQAGYPSMQAELTLSGLVDQTDETKTAAWLFDQYSTTSPLYRQDILHSLVTVDLGLYTAAAGGTPEYVRKFTGLIDSYQVSPDGSVSFTCIDYVRASLRSLPQVPAVITAPPANAGLTSEFAMDAILRAASDGVISSWPAQRSSCVLAVGFRSSLWPEVGSFDTSGDQPTASYSSGIYGSGLSGATYDVTDPLYWTNPTYLTSTGVMTHLFVEFFGRLSSGSDQIILKLGTLTESFTITVSTSGLVGTLNLNTGGYTSSYSTGGGTVSVGDHYFAAAVTLPAVSAHNMSGTLYVDSTAYPFTVSSGTGSGNRVFATWSSFQAYQAVNGVLSGLQVTTETSPATNASFTPGAVYDQSLTTLTVVPDITSGDPFSIIQQIVDAELGVAGGDEAGVFRFHNRNTIRSMPSTKTITSATCLSNISSIQTSAAGYINMASVEYLPWSYASAKTTVWSATTPIKVAKKSTNVFVVSSDSVFCSPEFVFYNRTDGATDTTSSYYRASTTPGGAHEHPGGFTFSVTQLTTSTAQLSIQNSSTIDAYFVSPASYLDMTAGTPLLWLAGLPATQGDAVSVVFQYPPVSAGGAVSSRFGELSTQITGNSWIQNEVSAYSLAQDIVIDQAVVRPDLSGVEIVPDPRIQLIDVVHIVDTDRTFVDEYARVFGWTISWEAGDPMTYNMTLDARTVSPPGGWILGVTGRSELSTGTFVYG